MQKKKYLILLVVLILTLGATTAFARYSHTAQISVTFSISGSTAACEGYVIPSSTENTASVSVRLQKKVGSSWNTVNTWSGTASGAGFPAWAGGTYTLTSGYDYRVYVVGTVKDPSGTVLETTNITSSTKTY